MIDIEIMKWMVGQEIKNVISRACIMFFGETKRLP